MRDNAWSRRLSEAPDSSVGLLSQQPGGPWKLQLPVHAAEQSMSFSLCLLRIPTSVFGIGLVLSYMQDSGPGKRTVGWQVGLSSGLVMTLSGLSAQ